jgi:cobyrinic acid a,c-diamide synthase
MTNCPALFVAAPASGQGKTSVVAALARAHTRAGRRVRVFKCGPDFLDPQIHRIASGQPCYNLDLRMCGLEDARQRLHAAASNADLILVEGVMGLFDGEPDSAELARQLGLPILLVMDASAMAGCFGAIVWGLKHYGAGAPISAALANQVASSYHAELCQKTLPADVLWYGALPRSAGFALPERHLGLLPAAEMDSLEQILDSMADAVQQTGAISLPPAVAFEHSSTEQPPALLAGTTIAIAQDRALCFIYPANLDYLRALGAELCFFSPLQDQQLPACDAVWLPGGYPELHAAQLAANQGMAASLRQHVESGKPLLAECGGMMLLFERLFDLDGQEHRMWGLLPGSSRMQPRLAGLGIQQMSLPEGHLRGHSFHYSHAETTAPLLSSTTALSGRTVEAVYRRQRLTASYMHSYFPGSPHATASLFLP